MRLTREEIEDKAKKKYKRLMKEPIYCPALKSDIYFTNKGWNHIVHNGSRPFDDIYRRLKLFSFIRPIISKTKNYRTRVMGNTTSFELSSKRKITIYKKTQNKLIKVVIILTTQKKYTFLSVM